MQSECHVCAFCRKVGHSYQHKGGKDGKDSQVEEVEFKRPRNDRVSLDERSPNGDSNLQDSLCSGSSIDACNSQQVSQCNANSVSSGSVVGSVKSKPMVQPADYQTEQAADVVEKDTIKYNHKTAFENLLCIEFFSGSGRLTATIRKMGMRAVAIDRSSDRTSGPVMTPLDLTKAEDLEFLKNFIISERANIVYIHLAPPCFLFQRQFRLALKLARRASHKEGRVYGGNIGISPAWGYTTLRWSVTGTWIAMQQTRTVVRCRCSSRPHLVR